MEGTSSTLHHLQNGLTWALLMNAWAKDTDYDGLIKYALSSISYLPLWHNTSANNDENDEFLVVSADCLQCVRILLSHSQVMAHVAIMKSSGYILAHINALSQSDDVLFNFVWSRNEICKKEWFVHMDITVSKFDNFINLMHENGLYACLLESYIWKGELCHIFMLEKCVDVEQKIYCVEDKTYHRKIFCTYFEMGYCLKTQCVLEYDSKVLISAVYDQVSYVIP